MNDELPEDEHARRLADVLHTLKPTPSEAAEISELARDAASRSAAAIERICLSRKI